MKGGEDHFFYPFPQNILLWQILYATILLTLISFFVLIRIKKNPYLFVGWFWYLIALVPVIGIIQAGLWPAMADRWTYVPFIGLFIILSWGINDIFTQHLNIRKTWVVFLILLVTITPFTWQQIRTWQNDITLLDHAITVTKNNSLAHGNLGGIYLKSGRIFEAVDQLSRAIKINPVNDKVHSNLGAAFYLIGRPVDAINHLQEALKINSNMDEASKNLDKISLELEMMPGAVRHYNEDLLRNPDNAKAHYNLDLALFRLGKTGESIEHLAEAVRLKPNWPSAQQALSVAVTADQYWK